MGGIGGVGGEESLAFLRNQPQFAQMRTLLQQNPALLAPLLQQLAQSNPQLLQLINENQNEFYNMINESIDTESVGSGSGAGGSTGGSGAPSGVGGGTGGGSSRAPGSNYITVTPQEREAIDRVIHIRINIIHYYY
jgi:UV excision repair protein RAD23